jgi:hypothetical protein
MNHTIDIGAVVERTVGGPEVLQQILVAFAAHFRVHARRERIGDTQIVPGGSADSYT